MVPGRGIRLEAGTADWLTMGTGSRGGPEFDERDRRDSGTLQTEEATDHRKVRFCSFFVTGSCRSIRSLHRFSNRLRGMCSGSLRTPREFPSEALALSRSSQKEP